MAHITPLQQLREEERRARVRLSAFRARLYRPDGASPMATRTRLQELERSWRLAAERLKTARERTSRGG